MNVELIPIINSSINFYLYSIWFRYWRCSLIAKRFTFLNLILFLVIESNNIEKKTTFSSIFIPGLCQSYSLEISSWHRKFPSRDCRKPFYWRCIICVLRRFFYFSSSVFILFMSLLFQIKNQEFLRKVKINIEKYDHFHVNI